MKLLLVCLLASMISFMAFDFSFAEKGTYSDKIIFIQYLDENTALEEVRNGNLGMYYYRIPSERIETSHSREGLKVFDSTGGSYSILINPAESETFNPFSIADVRFAVHSLVDRKLIINELMGGYGTTMFSNYGPFDPDFLSIVDQIESFHIRYNPSLANEMISKSLQEAGAQKIDNKWTFEGKPIELTFFIRSDDPVRKSIGEILASELENLGFVVKKDFGDLNKAFHVVYGSNPAELQWHLYTEGWGGRSAFVRYDSVGLGQMCAPWFSNMPGFNDPSYWNYNHTKLDSLTQSIYIGNFSSAHERASLIQEGTIECVRESVRVFLASKIDQYVVNEEIEGVINDFGAGVPSRFTAINSRSNSDTLVIGVKQIYQGAWNPVMGFSDIYSRQIWDTLYDPAIFKHPYTGENIPIRTTWEVETAGPNGNLTVPTEAITWDPLLQQWKNIKQGTNATSKVVFELTFSNWHHGKSMDMNDVLNSFYFTKEWGSEPGENDKTVDTEFTPRASQSVGTLIAINPLDENTLEVYVDYWHFDDAEIADWASLWSSMPWEIYAAMEKAVIDGKVSFSRSGAVSKNVNWMSLIVPNDAQTIQQYLGEFRNSKYIPPSMERFMSDQNYFESRYEASYDWIDKNNHAIISNGPFYLESYSPESRTITIQAFDDDSYPFEEGYWSEFENVKFPKIVGVEIPELVTRGESLSIPIMTEDSTQIQFFFINPQGQVVSSGTNEVFENTTTLFLSEQQTSELGEGANDLKLFAVSDSVLRPGIFSTSFFVSGESDQELPKVSTQEVKQISEQDFNYAIAGIIISAIVGFVVVYFKKRNPHAIKN